MRILFIVPYSSEGASNRFRVEQYLPYLNVLGIDCILRPFVSKKFFNILYLKGKHIKKIIYFLKAFWLRIMDIAQINKYDLIFIHREACPFGPPIFEWLAYKFKKPIIFDFDDAIFLENFNPANRFCNFLKFPSKTKEIIKISSKIIVTNKFLEEYAREFNPNVYVIPTPIDTDRFNVIKKTSEALTVGWIGSPTTAPYLQIIYGVMQKLSQKYDFIFKIVGAGEDISIAGVRVKNYAWQLDRELQDFQNLDIGIYPLPNNLWTQGKAGFKAIQYMAVGVPVVASSVGMVKDFIEDGVNGYLAKTEEEWVEKISKLMEDSNLRRNIGFAGRKTVEEKYSVSVHAPRFIEIIKKSIDCNRVF